MEGLVPTTLARPLYVWDRRGDKLPDLALFAFVQGTDPEVVLLLEATDAGKGQPWRYPSTRRSMGDGTTLPEKDFRR